MKAEERATRVTHGARRAQDDHMSMTKWLELSAQSIALGIVGKHLIGTLFRYPLTYPKRVKNSLCSQETIKKLSLSLSLPLMAIRPLALGLGPGGWRVAWPVAGTRHSHPVSALSARTLPSAVRHALACVFICSRPSAQRRCSSRPLYPVTYPYTSTAEALPAPSPPLGQPSTRAAP